MSAEARVFCLDVTRLIGRAGKAPLTGIDRVERAYLAHLIARGDPFLLACRTATGFLLVAPPAAPQVLRWIDDVDSLPPTGALARFLARTRRTPGLEAALRTIATRRVGQAGLIRHLAAGSRPVVWLTVGHANLTDRFMRDLGRVAGLSVVAMIHDTVPLDHPEWSGPRAPAEFAMKLECALGHARLILCPSGPVAAAVGARARAGGHRPTVVTAPLGVTPSRPAPGLLAPDLPRDRPYFVALGTIEPRKDHALLLDVWDRLHQMLPDAEVPRLFIVGRRGWRNEAVFRRLDTAPFMGRTVHELNGLPDGAVAALLVGAAALLAPSRAEGFGLPAAEAATLGVPVIASDLPVTREVVNDWPTYLPPGDIDGWAAAIAQMAVQAKDGPVRRAPAPIPCWDAHFNLVFSHF